MEILIVCTANICRSVLAAALLRERLGDAVTIRSAGLIAGGNPADAVVCELLAARGHDLGEHRSRRIDRAAVASADLIIGMGRQHVREVVVLDRSAHVRAFTLLELVHRAEQAGPRPTGTSMRRWLRHLHQGRSAQDLIHDEPQDDIADPRGIGQAAYERTVEQLSSLTQRLVAMLWPHGVVEDDDDDVEDFEVGYHHSPGAYATVSASNGDVRVAAARTERDLELWLLRERVPGMPGTVGLVAERPGVRLARTVEEALSALGYALVDSGNEGWVTSSWVECARMAAEAVRRRHLDVAITLTESATGVAIVANRLPGVHAISCGDGVTARRSRRLHGANVLCIGADTATPVEAYDIAVAFLRTPPGPASEITALDGFWSATETPL